jgi:hypothetical protein
MQYAAPRLLSNLCPDDPLSAEPTIFVAGGAVNTPRIQGTAISTLGCLSRALVEAEDASATEPIA